MIDPLEQFESELSRLQPRAAKSEWSRAIAAELVAEKRSDRMLIAAMSIGALAACLIAVLLIDQSSASTPPSGTVASQQDYPRFERNTPAFARADLDAGY
jgi:hypothetical protein